MSSSDDSFSPTCLTSPATPPSNAPTRQGLCTPVADGPPGHGSTPAQIHRVKVDEQISQLSQPWLASLPFTVRVIENDTVKHLEDVSDVEFQHVDIVHYLNGQKYPTHKLYFSRVDYEPPSFSPFLDDSDLSKVSSWISLKKDLCQAAQGAGSPIFSDGRSKQRRIFRCICYHQPKPSVASTESPKDYRSTTMVNNDKGNRRSKGRNLSRRTKGLDTTIKCSYMFNISWDNSGYFVHLTQRSGKPYHHDHPRIFDPQNIPMHTQTSHGTSDRINFQCG